MKSEEFCSVTHIHPVMVKYLPPCFHNLFWIIIKRSSLFQYLDQYTTIRVCYLTLLKFQLNYLDHHSVLVSYLSDKNILYAASTSIGYAFSCKSADDPPALDALRNFPVKNRHSDIAAEIGPDYEKFGTLLLEDKTGYKIKIIRMQEHNDPLRITIEILQQWLQGKGRKPVVWQTLVKCLQETGLEVLADNMKHSLSEHNRSKNPDRVHSEEL